MLEAGRKGTNSSTRPKVSVLASRGKQRNTLWRVHHKHRCQCALHLIHSECVVALPSYLLLWLSCEHKARPTKPIRMHHISTSHTIRQSAGDLMSGTQPMDQSKHSHQGHSSSHAFRE